MVEIGDDDDGGDFGRWRFRKGMVVAVYGGYDYGLEVVRPQAVIIKVINLKDAEEQMARNGGAKKTRSRGWDTVPAALCSSSSSIAARGRASGVDDFGWPVAVAKFSVVTAVTPSTLGFFSRTLAS
ncbi:hypothetical protein M8C21_005426 [Ambrosia artemisiifolia]|uniref:Uncharacterized protein n=1 Tax=Ambrosia artemisiifolia TaxID=4212 RepID=A0AAD5DEG3_AMBAR|nr:hypothetical protein M8C21_005426 [Ambrosia artemisiifolia]